jgi:YD repeat-containing protein
VKCIPNQYASYDAMGNMTCRNTDTTSGHTCGNSPTGALMTYDVEGRLTKWTAPSGTTATDTFLYDGEGNRVLQEINTSSITDTITFDGYTETVLSGGTITPTKYYNVNGQRLAMRTSSTLSYLLADALGSSTIALTSTGSTQAVQLFAPIWCPVYTIYKRQALPGLPPDLWSSHTNWGAQPAPLASKSRRL